MIQDGFVRYFKSLDLKKCTIVQSTAGYWAVVNQDEIPVAFMGDDFLEALMRLQVEKDKPQSVKPIRHGKPYYRHNERWG